MRETQSVAPASPLEVVATALKDIAESVHFRQLGKAVSHTPIQVSGIELPEVTQGLGRALVGVLAGAVRCNIRLAAELLSVGLEDRLELLNDVTELVGANNSFTREEEILFRDTKRNAWIAEGVLHILLVLQGSEPADLLGGRIQALRQLHSIPTQQGFDAVALYLQDGELSIAIGESKASREDGSGQLTEAAKIFKSIDSGEHGRHLRQELTALEGYLSTELAEQVSRAVLKRRCYVPSIVHEKGFDVRRKRTTLEGLAPPVERKRLLVVQLTDFHGFFDSVADAMRSAVSEIVV